MDKILNESHTIAVFGISSNPSKTSRRIAEYLVNVGYKVVGINPTIPHIENIDVYGSLSDVPFEIDIVDVFRKSEDIPNLIPDVLACNPKCLWLQLGIRNDEAVKPVEDANILVIQDYCIKIAHQECI